jgi:hypothetical protein
VFLGTGWGGSGGDLDAEGDSSALELDGGGGGGGGEEELEGWPSEGEEGGCLDDEGCGEDDIVSWKVCGSNEMLPHRMTQLFVLGK